jgi:hypothetical protein
MKAPDKHEEVAEYLVSEYFSCHIDIAREDYSILINSITAALREVEREAIKEEWKEINNTIKATPARIRVPDEHSILNAQYKIHKQGSTEFMYGVKWAIEQIKLLNQGTKFEE